MEIQDVCCENRLICFLVDVRYTEQKYDKRRKLCQKYLTSLLCLLRKNKQSLPLNLANSVIGSLKNRTMWQH